MQGSMPGQAPRGRGPVEEALVGVMSPPYLVLPPTQRYRHPVVAHGDYGMVAVVAKEGMAFKDEATGLWDSSEGGSFDPDEIARDAVERLSEAARAPPGRIACVVWLPQAIDGRLQRMGLCTSGNPSDLAKAVDVVMTTRLMGVPDPMAPWIGAYAAAALGPKAGMDAGLKRIVSLIESVVSACVLDRDIVCFGSRMDAFDMADPRFMLPALATAAFEDWGLVVGGGQRGRRQHAGFSISLEPDPAALLGYRVERLTPASPFTALAPIVSTLRRCQRRDQFVVDDLAEQFGRYLHKHGVDASFVDQVGLRLASAEMEDG